MLFAVWSGSRGRQHVPVVADWIACGLAELSGRARVSWSCSCQWYGLAVLRASVRRWCARRHVSVWRVSLGARLTGLGCRLLSVTGWRDGFTSDALPLLWG